MVEESGKGRGWKRYGGVWDGVVYGMIKCNLVIHSKI